MFSASRFLSSFFACIAIVATAAADEPFLRPHDVIALVGGEDMAAAGEYGYLEFALVSGLPGQQLRFRSLAWEGDTLFEQRRELNFPPLEVQLDKIGATVVVCQFGQMECLAGKDALPAFTAAYEKLIERLRGSAGRRLVLVPPHSFDPGLAAPASPERERREDRVRAYAEAVRRLAERTGCLFCDRIDAAPPDDVLLLRDEAHWSDLAHRLYAPRIARAMGVPVEGLAPDSPLLDLIRAKNRLWFNYWRPQNWAFLSGDRTQQPSSRDHLDPSKRWFPDEIEQFVPLIEEKERAIDQLAKQLAKP